MPDEKKKCHKSDGSAACTPCLNASTECTYDGDSGQPNNREYALMLFAKWVALVMFLTVYSRRPESTIRPGRHSNSPARPPKRPRGTRTGTEESRTGPLQSRNRPVRPSRRTSTSGDESTGQASASDGHCNLRVHARPPSISSRPTMAMNAELKPTLLSRPVMRRHWEMVWLEMED